MLVDASVQVTITKRTEPFASTACFSGFVLSPGGKLLEVSPVLAFHQPDIGYDLIAEALSNCVCQQMGPLLAACLCRHQILSRAVLRSLVRACNAELSP
jgi:hypothetical protein